MPTINLSKGQAGVTLRKTPAIKVSCSWPAATDYDLYALVVERDGHVHHVAMFGASGIPAQKEYKGIRHFGDEGRQGGGLISRETLMVALDDSIAAVVPVAYSAQSNGTGSFYEYQVSLAVDNGAGDRVEIDANNANQDRRIYTCVPAIIHNHPHGVEVEPVELYSQPSSENRPRAFIAPNTGRVVVEMDRGPRNNYK